MILHAFKKLFFCLALVCSTGCARNSVLKENNPQGIVFECRKIQEFEVPNVGTVVVTGFQAQNIFPGQYYYLKREDDRGNITTIYTFFSDEDGRLFAVQNHKIITALDKLRMMEVDSTPAQRSKYWLISKNGDTVIQSSYVPPYELQAVATDGASISIESINYNPIVSILGKGFQANEQVKIRSTSDNECIEHEYTCSADGNMHCAICLQVIDKQAITATFEVIRQSGEELKIYYERYFGINAIIPG